MAKLEFCISSVDDTVIKSALVHQIEFCSSLDVGGLTPNLEEAKILRSQVSIPVKIMIRHRAGNFVYNEDDIKTIYQLALNYTKEGFNRLVFGATHQDGRLNMEQIINFCKTVFPAKVCIHKAIDESPQILEDLKSLCEIENITEVLTSGGKPTAWEGRNILNQMVETCGGKIDIIAAGSIRHFNLAQHMEVINTPIFHGRMIV
jgi:copper homeostasis protein